MIEVFQDRDDVHRFQIKSASGGVLLKSNPFANGQDVKNAVAEIKKTTASHLLFERRTNHDGKFFFKVRLQDGTLVGNSQLYDSEAGLENGIKNLKTVLSTL
ncbi:MAG: hypothetical protein CMH48_03110 [Muricauda sp.]|nr:YegP family protein [Allomuricauda sp.]MAU26108.1 hypothetical protein [Allomuricauda sp.]MBC29811.1 hypothetical protein [Allomuricauda sp.]|tara:strand:+ start:45543 stop:45848 length:306 start_codon:yes stop_codon:yes gene_type:complete